VFSAESVIWGEKRNSLAKSLSGFLCFLPLSCLTLSSSLSILSLLLLSFVFLLVPSVLVSVSAFIWLYS
jgi:hypothetical protein